MTEDTNITGEGPSSEGRALWRMARQGVLASGNPADGTLDEALDEAGAANLLAAYLDGGLDEAAGERVEAWLAADAGALDRLIAARAGLEAEAVVPPDLIGRAQGLVRARPAAAGGGVLARLRGFLLPEMPLWQPVGLAAALLLACVVGFELGEEGYADLLAEPAATEADGGFDLAALSDDLF